MKHINLILSVVFLLGGCSSAQPHKTTPTVKNPNPRCKVLGKKVGKYSSVLVRKDCIRNGVTEVTILLHAVKNAPLDKKMDVAEKARNESAQLMLDILQFKPKLAAMSISRVMGIPCYVFLVTGIMPD